VIETTTRSRCSSVYLSADQERRPALRLSYRLRKANWHVRKGVSRGQAAFHSLARPFRRGERWPLRPPPSYGSTRASESVAVQDGEEVTTYSTETLYIYSRSQPACTRGLLHSITEGMDALRQRIATTLTPTASATFFQLSSLVQAGSPSR
jgi:hypothetical protein